MIRESTIATFGRVFGRGIGFFAQVMVARLLAPEGFGLFAIGWTVLRLFSIAGHFGLDYGVVSFGARYWQKDANRLRSIIIICVGGAFLSGAIASVLVYSSASWIAEHLFKKVELEFVLRGFALAFPLATMLRVLAAANSVSGKMLYGAIAEDIVQPAAQIASFLIFFNMGMGLSAAVFSTILSYALAAIIGLIAVGKNIPSMSAHARITTEDFLPVLLYSVPAIAGATLGALNLWGDRLIVGYFGTTEQTGIYQSISLVTVLTTILLSGIKIAIAPTISQMFHQDNHTGITLLAKSITRWSLYLALPFLIVIFLVPEDLLSTIFGQGYRSGTLPLLLLTIGQACYILFGIADQFFLMTGKQKIWLTISATIFLLTIIFDAILIPRAGLVGAGFVSCAMMLLLGITSATALRKYLHVNLIDIYHVKILIAALMGGGISYLVMRVLAIGPPLNIAAALLLSIINFVAMILLSGMEPGDKFLIRNLFQGSATDRNN